MSAIWLLLFSPSAIRPTSLGQALASGAFLASAPVMATRLWQPKVLSERPTSKPRVNVTLVRILLFLRGEDPKSAERLALQRATVTLFPEPVPDCSIRILETIPT